SACGAELTCAGTVIADRLGDLATLELDRAPWDAPTIAGTIEFAGFAVSPGSRRGASPDAAAAAFVAALAQIEPHVRAALDRQLAQWHATSGASCCPAQCAIQRAQARSHGMGKI